MLKIYNDIQQGTDEWLDIRKGVLTASRFGDLLTMPRSKADREAGNMSQTTRTYLVEKITEVLTGENRELSSAALDWGKEYEDEARSLYEIIQICQVKQIGFAREGLLGCSPDGLVDEEGGIEIKCPFNSNYHTEYLLGGDIPKGYYAQMQGNMMILDRKWWDFVSYDPRVKDPMKRLFIARIPRDEKFIGKIQMATNIALKHYQKMLKEFNLEVQEYE